MLVAIKTYLTVKKNQECWVTMNLLTAAEQDDLGQKGMSCFHYTERKGSKEGCCWAIFERPVWNC